MAFPKPRKSLLILLLSAFVYWATGLAQCLHERYEHSHTVAQTTLPPIGARALPVQLPKPAPMPDDHDDCATCQSLKIMKVAPVAPPMLAPEPTLLRHESPTILHRDAPVLSFVVFIPARAPPTLWA